MFLYWFLIALHIVISLCLMVVVLLQSGKGGGLAGAFGGTGGASQTLFGGRGAGTFLTKATQILGGAFMVSALVLVMMGGTAGRQGGLSEESLQLIESFQEEPFGGPGIGYQPSEEGLLPPVGSEAPPLEEGLIAPPVDDAVTESEEASEGR